MSREAVLDSSWVPRSWPLTRVRLHVLNTGWGKTGQNEVTKQNFRLKRRHNGAISFVGAGAGLWMMGRWPGCEGAERETSARRVGPQWHRCVIRQSCGPVL